MTTEYEIIKKYMTNLICGEEIGFFEMQKEYDLELNNNNTMNPIIQKISVNYFNKIYKSLILENDKNITSTFENMIKVMQHSMICLLNILCRLKINTHISLNRQILNIQRYEDFIASIKIQTEMIIEKNKYNIIDSLSHTCEMKNIKDYDPNKPMFELK